MYTPVRMDSYCWTVPLWPGLSGNTGKQITAHSTASSSTTTMHGLELPQNNNSGYTIYDICEMVLFPVLFKNRDVWYF